MLKFYIELMFFDNVMYVRFYKTNGKTFCDMKVFKQLQDQRYFAFIV